MSFSIYYRPYPICTVQNASGLCLGLCPPKDPTKPVWAVRVIYTTSIPNDLPDGWMDVSSDHKWVRLQIVKGPVWQDIFITMGCSYLIKSTPTTSRPSIPFFPLIVHNQKWTSIIWCRYEWCQRSLIMSDLSWTRPHTWYALSSIAQACWGAWFPIKHELNSSSI